MNLQAVMAELGSALETISGLRVTPYAANRVSPPAAVVGLPETIEYDVTYGRGSDVLTLPVVVMVGKASDRASHAALAAYADGSGTSSVKAAVESFAYTACDSVRVQTADFDVIKVADVDYLAVTFAVEVIGSGS